MTRTEADAAESEDLTQVIGEFYDAVLDPDLWPVALEHSCHFVGGAAANIFWQDVIDQSATVFHSWGDDPAFQASYLAHYVRLNPMFPALTFVEPGVVISGGDLIPHPEFAETRFFKEWVKPQGFVDVIGANLQRYQTSSACFSIRRGERHGYVDVEARRRTALLVPHVRRAVLIGRELDRQRAKSATLEEVLQRLGAGVFLVDPAGRLSLVNEVGREMLDRGDLLAEREGALAAADPGADRALQDTLARTGIGGGLPGGGQGDSIVLTRSPHPRWLAHVLPLASGARLKASLGYWATAAVFVRQAELPVASGIESIAKVYRLTPSEIRVLQAVVSEGSVIDIAEALGISASTVKTHLAALFAKTGTNRRADLIKTVAAHGNPLS